MIRVALVAAIALASARPAHAQDLDYRVENHEWNGLSTFMGLARSHGFRVEAVDRLDWSQVTTDDVVLILHPTALAGAWQLPEFVERGGRLLVADDFGDGRYAFGLFDLDAAPLPAEPMRRLHRADPDLPVAVAVDAEHPLARGVEGLTTNHPSAFATPARGTVFALDDEHAVVVAGERGRGRWVALSDPSVLINNMLEQPGNLAFASNLLRHLAADPLPGANPRVYIVSGAFVIAGDPVQADRRRGTWNGFLADVNQILGGLNDYVTTDVILWAVGLVLSGLVVLALGFWRPLPFSAPAPLDGSWTRATSGAEAPGLAATVAQYDEAGIDRSFAQPACLLRERVEHAVAQATQQTDPLETLSTRQIEQLARTALGKEGAAALARVAGLARKVPSRGQLPLPWASRLVSRKEFEALHDEYRRARTYFDRG